MLVSAAPMRALCAAVLVLFAMTGLSSADDRVVSESPVGAAIALSVEPAAIGYCRDRDAGRAMECALAECRADGGESCRLVEWCAVAGMSGVMFGYNTELGMSGLFAACGGFSRDGIEAILKAKCATDARHDDCTMVVYWDHEGVDHRVGD